jgi:hypothetical protein
LFLKVFQGVVSLETRCKVSTATHHPTVVHTNLSATVLGALHYEVAAVVTSSVGGIAVVVVHCLGCELFWEALGALSIFHAGGCPMVDATRAVDHASATTQ